MKPVLTAVTLIGVASLLGCGARTTGTDELTGYLFAPRSSICLTQAADPSLPDLKASLDTVVTSRPAAEVLAGGSFESICGPDGEPPVTSLRLLRQVSDVACPPQNLRGCLEGHARYRIAGTFEQTEICYPVSKGQPPDCEAGEVFLPTGVSRD